MCGPKPANPDELKSAIKTIINNGYVPDEKYMSLRNQYYGEEKTMCDIWDDIKNNTKI